MRSFIRVLESCTCRSEIILNHIIKKIKTYSIQAIKMHFISADFFACLLTTYIALHQHLPQTRWLLSHHSTTTEDQEGSVRKSRGWTLGLGLRLQGQTYVNMWASDPLVIVYHFIPKPWALTCQQQWWAYMVIALRSGAACQTVPPRQNGKSFLRDFVHKDTVMCQISMHTGLWTVKQSYAGNPSCICL